MNIRKGSNPTTVLATTKPDCRLPGGPNHILIAVAAFALLRHCDRGGTTTEDDRHD